MISRSLVFLAWLGLLAGCSRPMPQVTPATSAEVLNAVRAPGSKVVLLNLWASWCGPCREEFPDLVRLQKKYADRGLKIVFVSWDDTAEEAARFLAKQGMREPSFIKNSAESDQVFFEKIEPKLTGVFPTTVLYDGAGKLRSVWEGAVTYAQLEQAINPILKGQP
jgi:thiol-disulfide isomerase/thioredoxin